MLDKMCVGVTKSTTATTTTKDLCVFNLDNTQKITLFVTGCTQATCDRNTTWCLND